MKKKVDHIRLFKNHKRSIGYWDIWSEDNIIVMESGTSLHSNPIQHTETVTEGKQGRTVLEQVQFRIKSRINSKYDNGYVTSYDAAKVAPTDAEGKVKPQLATQIEDYKGTIDEENSFVQIKYNGHRCLITKQNGEVFAYSRNGKKIPGIPHVLNGINIEEGQILDGEVYKHGWALQQIASAAKKLQPDSKFLQYHCYDVYSELPYSDRLRRLRFEYGAGQYGKYTKLAPTRLRSDIENLHSVFVNVRDAGYEGLILRLGEYPYEAGRRSKGLLKIKKMHDSGYYDNEFIVIDILPSKNNWARLVCQLPNGGTFRVSAPGTIPQREETLANKDEYIGRKVRVEYPELTQDEVPFQPVAICWYTEL